MRKFTIAALALVSLTTLIGIASAVRPSGPGQSTKANSLSVAVASDQTVPVSIATAAVERVPTVAAAITPSDDAGASNFATCTHSVLVGVANADGGVTTVTAIPSGGDAGVLFTVSAHERIPGSFSRINSTGTTATGIVCQGF